MTADCPDLPAKQPRTIVYIDGFNFYYGAVKGTPHKWLDFEALCRRLLRRDHIIKIRYFTARVAAQADDLQRPARQATYLRALATLSLVEIHFGHFVTRAVRLPLATPPAHGRRTVEVLRTEERLRRQPGYVPAAGRVQGPLRHRGGDQQRLGSGPSHPGHPNGIGRQGGANQPASPRPSIPETPRA